MKIYIASLVAGLLVGAIYGLLNVRSPAPPVVALIGLFGILAGEQIVPVARAFIMSHLHHGGDTSWSWVEHQIFPHMFGRLPEGKRMSSPKSRQAEADI